MIQGVVGKPLQDRSLKENLTTKADYSHFMSRTEVKSSQADSHLGHVFF